MARRPVLLIALAVAAATTGVEAGLYAPADGILMDPAVAFQDDLLDLSASCPGAFLLGVAAIDISPYDLASFFEPYEDLNGNGVYDAPDPVEADPEGLYGDPWSDEIPNGKYDGLFMAGYGREKVGNEYYMAAAVHDPVWARALAYTCGDVTLGTVSVDTVGLFRDFVQTVRAAAPTDYDHVAVASTHTHDSVDTMGLWGPSTVVDGKNPRLMDHYRAGILAALSGALLARTTVDHVVLGMARTRDLIPYAGPIQTDLRDPFVIDDRVLAARYVEADGSTIATVVNWSPHPETLAGTRSEISSDYPHWLRRAIETDGATVFGKPSLPAVGGTAVFFSGAVGGMMTTLGAKPRNADGTPTSDYGYDKAERIGVAAAYAALGALGAGTTAAPDGLRIQVRESSVPADNPFLLALNTIGVFDHQAALGPVPVPAVGEPGIVAPVPFFRAEVDVLTVRAGGGDALQMLTVPGELLPEVALGNPLVTQGEPTLQDCFAYVALKEAFNGAREAKWDPATVDDPGGLRRAAGFARVMAARPAYPKEPAIVDHSSAAYTMLFGLGNDELGYIVPADDYELATVAPSVFDHGRDRCGDDDHYEETNSASTYLAPAVANMLVTMMDPDYEVLPYPAGFAGTLAAGGDAQPVPDDGTRGVWFDTSRSGGYEAEEDLHVRVGLPAQLSGCWGFLDGQGYDIGQDPTPGYVPMDEEEFDAWSGEMQDVPETVRGLWVDIDADCSYGPGDGVVFADMWTLSEGQPHWRP